MPSLNISWSVLSWKHTGRSGTLMPSAVCYCKTGFKRNAADMFCVNALFQTQTKIRTVCVACRQTDWYLFFLSPSGFDTTRRWLRSKWISSLKVPKVFSQRQKHTAAFWKPCNRFCGGEGKCCHDISGLTCGWREGRRRNGEEKQRKRRKKGGGGGGQESRTSCGRTFCQDTAASTVACMEAIGQA